jgi:hypothetical protein
MVSILTDVYRASHGDADEQIHRLSKRSLLYVEHPFLPPKATSSLPVVTEPAAIDQQAERAAAQRAHIARMTATADGKKPASPATVLAEIEGARMTKASNDPGVELNAAVDLMLQDRGLSPVEPEAAIADPEAALNASIDRIIARSAPAAPVSLQTQTNDAGADLNAAIDRMLGR